MNTLTKRFIFCICGGVSGAALSLQFTSSWAVLAITILMAVTGWIAADVAAFTASVREFISSRVREPLITVHGIRATLLVLYGCSLVLIQSAALFLYIAWLLLPDAGVHPIGSFAREWRVMTVAVVMLILAMATICACSSISKRTAEQDVDRLWKAVGYANPMRWMPMILIGLAHGLVEFGKEAIRELHTSERAVYAVCFALGTLGGFWAGKHYGVPFGSVTGGAISFVIAWLDWKILSIKLGWRQAV